MNWTYLDSPIVCEECNVVLEEHSGYVGTQYGICDDCLARVTQSNTGLQRTWLVVPAEMHEPALRHMCVCELCVAEYAKAAKA